MTKYGEKGKTEFTIRIPGRDEEEKGRKGGGGKRPCKIC